ncbi:c-myc promoter binding protein [Anaeramoeba flamelloides]|uniref:C-myc promoter binding protein n=1 Tax=Anaeramoeba flamelloides TaxID=1746091 RepID=A0ABQ8YJZ6_9EUKA|nr:c-myc promoter binding protein [Anaeramoeba flamelloides]
MKTSFPLGSSIYEFFLILGKNPRIKIQPPKGSPKPECEPLVSHTLESQILDVYPDEKRTSLPPKIEEFAFPDRGIGIKNKKQDQLQEPYEFVLTNMEGVHFYGFSVSIYYPLEFEGYAQICTNFGDLFESSYSRNRRSHRAIPRDLYVESVLVLVSKWPFHRSFSKLLLAFIALSKINTSFNRKHLLKLDSYLSQIKSFETEKQSLYINLFSKDNKRGMETEKEKEKEEQTEEQTENEKRNSCQNRIIKFPMIKHNHENLPLTDIDFTFLFSLLDPQNVIKCFTALLCEKKIIFVSSNYRLIFPVIEAIKTLIYPFNWAFAYIPLLPSAYVEFLQAPTPYLIGCRRSTLLKIDLPFDIVIIDIDDNAIYSEEKLIAFPKNLQNRLLRNIKKYYNIFRPNDQNKNENEIKNKTKFSISKPIEVIEKESQYIVNSFSSSESSGEETNYFGSLDEKTIQKQENNSTRISNSKQNTRGSKILKIPKLTVTPSKEKRKGINSKLEQETEKKNEKRTNINTNNNIKDNKNKEKLQINKKKNNQTNFENNLLIKNENESKNKMENESKNIKENENKNKNKNKKEKEKEKEQEQGKEKEQEKGQEQEQESKKQEEIVKDLPELRRKFVTVFFSLFKKYRRFIIYPTKENPDPETIFQIEEFLENVSEEFHHFLKSFLNSQMFISFIESKLLDSTSEDEFDYFDINIFEKIQRRSIKYNIISTKNKSSFLFKRGHRIKSWKQRWFVLNQQTLKYFYRSENKNKKKPKLKLKGTIDLINGETRIKIPRTQPFHYTSFPFEILTKKKDYLICAQDNLTRLSWVNILRANCLSKKEVEFYKRLSPFLPYNIKTEIINTQKENAKKRRSPFISLFGWNTIKN